MAKKKDKVEVVEAEVSIQDTVNDTVETIEEVVEQIAEEQPTEEVVEEVQVQVIQETKPVDTQKEAVEFKDTDIVTFYNNKGELRWAAYKYITKRGYKAIELYKTKK